MSLATESLTNEKNLKTMWKSSSRNLSSFSTFEIKPKNYLKECCVEALKFKKTLKQTEFMELENHLKYLSKIKKLPSSQSEFNGSDELNPKIYKMLKKHDFDRFGMDLVLKSAHDLKYFQDCLPTVNGLDANLQVNFASCKALFGTGQAVAAQDTLYSPRVTIETNQDGLYTLLLTDLDRPNLEDGCLQEFCHWLVTDLEIKADEGLELESVLSRYVLDQIADSSAKQLPGNVIFDYLPIHPALSNPKSNHRYQVSLWRQSGPLSIDKAEWNTQAEFDRTSSLNLPPHQRLTETEREKELEIRQRSIPFPTLAFAKKHGLNLSGLSLFTSTFNIHTPQVFKSLGLHQPVYGKVKPETVQHLLRKIDVSTELAHKDIKTLDHEKLKRLNHGYASTLAQPRLPTRRDLRVTIPDSEPTPVSIRKGNGRLKRLTIYGAVGMVRNSDDVANGFMGEIRKEYQDGPSSYQNA